MATGGGFIVSTITSVTSEQGGLPVAESVMFTIPVSPGPGIYVGLKVEVFAKLPVPLWLHEYVILLVTEAPEIV